MGFGGFTLAEVLIILGIIGIVATLTIPNLVAKYQKAQTVQRLKLVYSQLNEAIRLSEVENDDISGWNFEQPSSSSFEQYLAPYMKIAQVSSTNSSSGFHGDGIKYYEISGNLTTLMWILRSPVDIYKTINGTDLILFKTSSSGSFVGSKQMSIYVDLNGIKTPPNQYGKDFFSIVISGKDGKRIYFPGTYSSSEYTFPQEPNTDRAILKETKSDKSYYLKGNYRYGCNKNALGHWCGRLIQVDGWKIKDDYPW